MNVKQLQYAIMLSEVGSFSQVAEKLNISQPALSKQILGLEKELGVTLFCRNTTPITLTAAGTHFVQEAQQLVYKEEQLLRSMEQYRTGEAGSLRVGISPFRCLYLMPSVLKRVRERFPGIRIFLHETGSDQLRKEAAEGKYDLAVVNLPVDESQLNVTPIEMDTLVLAVPHTMLHKLPFGPDALPETVDFADCRDLPFVVVGESQEMRRLFNKLCRGADITPNIAAEVVGVASAWAMAAAGVGATLLPRQFAASGAFGEGLVLLPIKSRVYTRQPVVVTKRGQYLSEAAAYLIELLTETE